MATGENLEQVKAEMDYLVKGKDALWEVGTLRHTSWSGAQLIYEPMHDPWEIEKDHVLTQAMRRAYEKIYDAAPDKYDFWDFGTNAVAPVAIGVPTIGFGPGEYKLAHMRNEHCSVIKIKGECCLIYRQCGFLERKEKVGSRNSVPNA